MNDGTYIREATDDERAASIFAAGRNQSGSGRIVADGFTCFVQYDATDTDWIVGYLDKQDAKGKAAQLKQDASYAWTKLMLQGLLAAIERLDMDISYTDGSHGPYWTFNEDERAQLLAAVKAAKGKA